MSTKLKGSPLVTLIFRNRRTTHLLDPERENMEIVNTMFGVGFVGTMDTPFMTAESAKL